MAKPIDKGWIGLTIARIVSVALAVFAAIVLIGAINLLHGAGEFGASANAHPHASEGEPHGLDSLGFLLMGGLGLIVLAVSVALFVLAFGMFFGTSWKLKKKAQSARQDMIDSQPETSVIKPDNSHKS